MAERSLPPLSGAPSDWVLRFSHLIPRAPDGDGLVLDLACGRGRHALWMSQRGHQIVAVDRTLKNINQPEAKILTPAKNSPDIPPSRPNPHWIEADLETRDPFAEGGCLHGQYFSGIIVVNYLYRPLFPGLIEALRPGGILIYETFAQGHETFGAPRNRAYLLKPGELTDLAWGAGMVIIAYQHGRVCNPGPALKQYLCARKKRS